ncbi:hypothetical protein D3C76_1212360 [compost metagenome]
MRIRLDRLPGRPAIHAILVIGRGGEAWRIRPTKRIRCIIHNRVQWRRRRIAFRFHGHSLRVVPFIYGFDGKFIYGRRIGFLNDILVHVLAFFRRNVDAPVHAQLAARFVDPEAPDFVVRVAALRLRPGQRPFPVPGLAGA